VSGSSKSERKARGKVLETSGCFSFPYLKMVLGFQNEVLGAIQAASFYHGLGLLQLQLQLQLHSLQ